MITLQELCTHLDTLLSPKEFPDRSPNGLQVEGKEEIHRVTTGVSASLETIEAAVASEADALVVHHGMFWEGDPYNITRSKKRKLQLLLDHGISLLAYHIPLDAHTEVGNNWKAARDLGWTELQAFGLFKGVHVGIKGSIAPTSTQDFTSALEEYYGHPASTALGGKDTIQRVALISGGAHWSIQEAIDQGVDAFVTGTQDEPIWNLAFEEGINFFALGHSATEKVGPKAIAQHLSHTLKLDTQFIDTDNPF